MRKKLIYGIIVGVWPGITLLFPQSLRVPLKVSGMIPVMTMGWSDGALRVMVVSVMPPVGMTTARLY